MKGNPRKVSIQNFINKGPLYQKSRGALNDKGKYAIILDKDISYENENVFSYLYEEEEKNNLDMLGNSIQGEMGDKFYIKSFHNNLILRLQLFINHYKWKL